MTPEQSAGEKNRAVVQSLFDALARGDQASANALQGENFVLELNYGHADGGAFQGAEIFDGRMRMGTLLGLTGIELREIIPDGDSRVVVLATASGLDADGEPWSIPAVQLIALENGKIATTSLMFQGHARIREITGPREAAANKAPSKLSVGWTD